MRGILHVGSGGGGCWSNPLVCGVMGISCWRTWVFRLWVQSIYSYFKCTCNGHCALQYFLNSLTRDWVYLTPLYHTFGLPVYVSLCTKPTSLANLECALIVGPQAMRTKGMEDNRTVILPRRVDAHLNCKFPYICRANSTNEAPIRFPSKIMQDSSEQIVRGEIEPFWTYE